jgi:hypothetical protein
MLAVAVIAGLVIGTTLVRRHNNPGLPVLPGPARRQAEAEAKLRTVLPRVRFQSTSLEKAFNELQAMSGARFVVDWDAIEGSNANLRRGDPVTLSLTDVTLEQALNALVGYVDRAIDYTLFDGIIVITTDKYVGDYLYAAVYDLRALEPVATNDSNQGEAPATTSPNWARILTSGVPVPPRVEMDDEITRAIEENVAPNERGNGTIRTFGGRVVTVTTWRNHRRIEAIVSELRNPSR